MKKCIAVSCFIVLAAMLAQAQAADEGYQMATVVSIEQQAADAQHMENADRYKISMRMGDTLYLCRASGSAATFMDWTSGKEFPAKENAKVLLVKNKDGKVLELTITGKKKPK